MGKDTDGKGLRHVWPDLSARGHDHKVSCIDYLGTTFGHYDLETELGKEEVTDDSLALFPELPTRGSVRPEIVRSAQSTTGGNILGVVVRCT